MPHIGCPCQCSFCDQRAITGGAHSPTAEDVLKAAEIGAATARDPKNTEIAFFGGSFTAIPREYMEELLRAGARAVKEYGLGGIRCSTRPDAIDPEIIDILKRYGVTSVELGAQSMIEDVLTANRRGHTAAQTAEAARLLREGGFELGVQMMTGLYGDTADKALETMARLIALHPATVRIYPTVVLKGTHLAELYEKGEYKPQTLEEAVDLCARLLEGFQKAGVRVIRMGLHAEGQVEENRVAGPYHPAFRQLVESRAFLSRLLPCLQQRGKGAYTVAVCPRELSTAMGQKKENLKRLAGEGFTVTLTAEEEILPGEFKVM